MLIKRDLAPRLAVAARKWPAVTLTGPRQSGKTTLCASVFGDRPQVSLEAPDVRAFAAEDARDFLAQFPDGAVIDEVQRVPELLSYLQGIIDADPVPGRWILTGSHNLALAQSVSQSLAGRTAVLRLLPLSRSEAIRFPAHPQRLDETLIAGGYPAIFDRELEPAEWLAEYVATYIERDVRTVSNVGDLEAFQRFVQLCAGRTSQLLNYSALAADCGVSQPTAKAWLSILEASFVVFRLPAFQPNLRKRLVRMAKLHFVDTGLACWLLGIREPDQLRFHPLRGALFETWVVSEVTKQRANQGLVGGTYHYRDRSGTEVDLVLESSRGISLVEAKASTTASTRMLSGPTRVRSHLASAHPQAEVVVIYGGDDTQRRNDGSLIPWHGLHRTELGP
ncbi:ATP-binding protein [Candidatus Poriferisodalis sp.]|uniref:ATP-binding protein n=1 Tax=Candidatus Poriferisodalis sp. TaxID=3101277 RepID=UPI003AF99665